MKTTNSNLLTSDQNSGIDATYLKTVPLEVQNLFAGVADVLPKTWKITASRAGGLRVCAGAKLASNAIQFTATPTQAYFLVNKSASQPKNNVSHVVNGHNCYKVSSIKEAQAFLNANKALVGSVVTVDKAKDKAKEVSAKIEAKVGKKPVVVSEKAADKVGKKAKVKVTI